MKNIFIYIETQYKMCIICEGKYKNTKYITIDDCPLLTSIPKIDGLLSLQCYNCPNLVSIPYIEGLNLLYVKNCLKLQNIPRIEGLQKLKCYDCPLLESLPIVEDMYWVKCYNCLSLKIIPEIEGCIGKFILHNCPLVTTIPIFVSVMCEYRDCPLLTSIPNDDEPSLCFCHNCKWLNDDYCNPEYGKNLNNLIIIQKYFRKYKKIKRMIRWVNSYEFNEWYYSPKNPGGKRAIARLNIKYN